MRPGGVLREQIAIVASDQGGAAQCSSSFTVKQAVEEQMLLDKQAVESPQESNTVTAAVLTSEADFDAISGEWDELVSSSCQQGVFFLRWHWNRVWWRMYAPPGSELFLIACRDRSGRLVGLAPLYRHCRSVKGLIKAMEPLL